MIEVLLNVVVESIKILVVIISVVVLVKIVFSLAIVDSLLPSKLVAVDLIPFVWFRLVEKSLIAVCVVDSMLSEIGWIEKN